MRKLWVHTVPDDVLYFLLSTFPNHFSFLILAELTFSDARRHS